MGRAKVSNDCLGGGVGFRRRRGRGQGTEETRRDEARLVEVDMGEV